MRAMPSTALRIRLLLPIRAKKLECGTEGTAPCAPLTIRTDGARCVVSGEVVPVGGVASPEVDGAPGGCVSPAWFSLGGLPFGGGLFGPGGGPPSGPSDGLALFGGGSLMSCTSWRMPAQLEQNGLPWLPLGPICVTSAIRSLSSVSSFACSAAFAARTSACRSGLS